MGSSIDLSQIAMQIPHEDMQFHRGTVADLLHRQNLKFPGAQPVSFARRHLRELQETDYFMCEKTDGIRCLLFLTQLVGDETEPLIEAQFLIDRKNEFWYVPRDSLHLPRPDDIASFHQGTILDGELVRQRTGSNSHGQQTILKYLIFDCLAVDGENITSRPFDKRLARIDALIWRPWRDLAKRYPEDVARQPFQIEMKKMEFPYATEMMFREKIPTLLHGNDGLIFTCRVTPYIPGTDQHILKWKPPHENTVDFRLLIGDFPLAEDDEGSYEDWDAKPGMELHVNHGDRGGYQFFANLTVTEAEWEAIKRLNEQVDGRIIECYRDPADGSWRPKVERDGSPRFRDDKTDANHISVVESVLESIEDAVSERDLIAEAARIRAAYKERQRIRDEETKRAVEEDKRRRAAHEQALSAQRRHAGSEDAGDDEGPRYED